MITVVPVQSVGQGGLRERLAQDTRANLSLSDPPLKMAIAINEEGFYWSPEVGCGVVG